MLHGMTALPHSLRSALRSVALSPAYPKKRSFEDLGLQRSWSRAHPPPRFACAGSRASAGSARIGGPGRTLRPSLRPRLDRRQPVAFSPAARWSLSTGTVAALMAEFAVEKWTDAPEGLLSATSGKSCLARELGCSTPEFPRCIQAFSADAASRPNFSYPEVVGKGREAHKKGVGLLQAGRAARGRLISALNSAMLW